jgi:hypothetical protein
MARIPLGGVTTLNTSTHLDPQTLDLYGIADYFRTPGYTGGSWKVGVDSGGNFMVGSFTNTTPISNRSNGMSVFGSGANFGAFSLRSASGSCSMGLATSTGNHINFYTDNGTTFIGAGNIASNGSTTSYNTSSDSRLKENIVDAGPSGGVIDSIRVRSFDWRDGVSGHVTHGFIAQELDAVFPGAVTHGQVMPGPDGNPMETFWSVDPSKLVALLVHEVQSLRARVAALEA